MEQGINLNDISDELLIIPKATIDSLTKLDDCSECIALYIFYYKTAKWQKTNQIKASDEYVKKSLKWCSNKIMKIKAILKEKGLINIVQQRKDGKISGWYIELNYLISNKKQEEIKIKVDDSKNSSFQELEKATTCNEEISALKEYIKCLKKEIEVLKENNKENESDKPKISKHKYGEYGNVLLTDEQYEKLKTEFPNDYEKRIENTDAYVQSTGNKYKDYLATIRNWARKEKKVSKISKYEEEAKNETW
jgi:hypothetical protein